jgi:hypothetical protein
MRLTDVSKRVLVAGGFMLACAVGCPRLAAAETFYVAPDGNDGAAGTMTAPFATMTAAQDRAAPGDTVYLRGGTYRFTSSSLATGVNLTKSGVEGKRINYWAYAGEVPVFDLAGMTSAQRIKGINVTASYVHLRGIELKNVPQNLTTVHESWGIYVDGGSHDVFELLNLHHNMGPGLFIQRGSENLVVNCDSHHNYDPKSSSGAGTNADGFGCHVNRKGDTGNVFRGCRAWWNSDDGFDLIQAQEPVVIESSWAWNNGYLPDSTTDASGGDGNGFKAGGYGLPATNVPNPVPVHVVRKSVAFSNRASGFYLNHHPGPDVFYSNTGYANRSANFNMMGLDGNLGTLRNNLAYNRTAVANGSSDDASNSWSLSLTLTDADFVSVDPRGVDGPRRADGSVPDLGFLRPAAGKQLIDKGRDVGLPFVGLAPDLGAFEYGEIASGGAPAAGGTPAMGGAPSNGGAGTGGAVNGGTPGTGASNGAGGVLGTGASGTEIPTGGVVGAGGAVASGGAVAAGARGPGGLAGGGGAPSTAGAQGDGAASGAGGAATGGAGDGGASGDDGCACHVISRRSGGGRAGAFWSMFVALGLTRWRNHRGIAEKPKKKGLIVKR